MSEASVRARGRLPVALDAMGGDNAPGEVVLGAVQAARDLGLGITLVGPEATVRTELARHNITGLNLEVANADEVIGMDEHPAEAVRAKRRNSMTVALELVRDGRAGAAVTAGNSGAMLAASLFTLRRIPGVERPALGAVFPSANGRRCLVADVGANTDSKPTYLVQFALMGAVYMDKVFGVPNPRVGLLSNGEEATKGDQLTQAAHQLLKAAAGPARMNFIGNVEGRNVFDGSVDVVACDGFVGNVLLKTSEGLSRLLLGAIRGAITSNPLTMAGGLLAQGAFGKVRREFDYEEYGGAPLLGVNGVSIIAHGRSGAKAIKSALRTASQASAAKVPALIQDGMAAIGARAGMADAGD